VADDSTANSGQSGHNDDLTPTERTHLNQAGRDAAELVRAHIAHDPDRAEALLNRCDTRIAAHQLARFLASIINADESTLKLVASKPATIFAAWEASFGKPPAS
jgi:hypothetical protein